MTSRCNWKCIYPTQMKKKKRYKSRLKSVLWILNEHEFRKLFLSTFTWQKCQIELLTKLFIHYCLVEVNQQKRNLCNLCSFISFKMIFFAFCKLKNYMKYGSVKVSSVKFKKKQFIICSFELSEEFWSSTWATALTITMTTIAGTKDLN